MDNIYRVDPDHVRPEPTPADYFSTLDGSPSQEEGRKFLDETFAKWREEGVQQVRITHTGPDVEGDKTGYPAGIWLEGWLDKNAVMLPFGAPWPTPDSAIWPPLTATPGGPNG